MYEVTVVIRKMTASFAESMLAPPEEADAAGFEDMARRLRDDSKIQRLIGYERTHDLGEMLEWIIAEERVLARHAEHRA